MGAFDQDNPIILPDPNDPVAAEKFRKKWGWENHEQVILKGSYTAADMESVTNASVASELGSRKGNQQNITIQSGTGRIQLMICMIKDWTFTANGARVPVNPRTIRQLPYRYQQPILEKCDELAEEMLDEEEQESFLKDANGHISENFDLMKLHQMKS